MKSKNVTHTFNSFSYLSTFLFAIGVFVSGSATAQSVFDNFEGTKVVRYTEKGGVLDTVAKNPKVDEVNKSAKCALYIRNGAKKFDNIKMGLPGNLTGVDKYATYLGIPPRFKMKIYTTAPAGTLIEILLGSKRGNNDYPAGTHSQYQAYTKTSNQWEEIEFLFSQIPQGSQTSETQIDQVVLLFNPNSSTSDTYYFDELTGPAVGAPSTGTTEGGPESVNTTTPETTPATSTTTTTVTPEKTTPKKSKKSKK